MKNSNFIKNSIIALLPISLGLTVLFNVPGSKAESAQAYTGANLPTTIYLNDPSESSIRSYYSSLNALGESERKGNNLLKNLKSVLSNGQKYYNYDSGDLVWKMYEITDRDWEKSPASSTQYGTYNSSTNTITNYVYGSNSSSKNNPYIRAYYMDRSQDNVVRAWGNHSQDGTGINREHLWAKAEGFDGSGAAGARGDPMHLVAANGYANNIHSNHFYGYVDKTKSYVDVKDKYSTLGHNLSGKSKTFPSSFVEVFEPQDCDKGDIARAIFYMAARYNNIAGKTASQETFDADNPNLLLTDDLSKWKTSGYTSTASSPGYHGLVSDLLEWNKIDPPDDFEIHRNNLLYTNFTNNRNPFIDFPDWADLIWGDSTTSADPISDPLNGQGTTKTVKSLTITAQPTKTVYIEGETFSPAGMIVTAKYSDNSTRVVTDYTYSPKNALTLGTDKVVVSYEGKTVDVPISVMQQGQSITRYFQKVESNFTSGSYLIVCDDELNVAWKTGCSGSTNVINVNYDDDENIIYSSDLGNALFSFDLENGYIYAPDQVYIYSDTNEAKVKRSDTPVSNTIIFNNGILTIQGSSGRVIKCNSNNGAPTFNFYSSSSSYNNISIYRLVEIYDDILPESITLSEGSLNLEIGNSVPLTADVLPVNTTNKSVIWTSSNPSVASVDENGRVVAKAGGSTTITARSNADSSVFATCSVTVQQPISLDRIEINGDYKTEYYVGEEFDTTGIEVDAIYIQGGELKDTVNVTDESEFSGFTSETVGIKTITVSYNNVSTSFSIHVLEIPVEENTIKVVSGALGYDNGSVVKSINSNNFEIAFTKGTNSGGNAPKYYTSGSSIRVYAGNTLSISGPYKIVGVSFVFGAEDGSNTFSVNKGTCNSSTGEWTSISGEDNLTFTIAGTTGNRRISEIHIKYDPNTTTVKELLSISLSGSYKTEFDVDDTFDYSGLVVTAHYNDGSTSVVTPDSVTGADMSNAGEQEITVTYTENEITKTATYTITVNETIILTGITLSGSYKTSYFVGESFDRSFLVVTAHYSDGGENIVTPNTVSGYDMNLVSSSQTVNVYYSENDVGVSASYTIEVKDILPESLEVSNIEKTDYICGDAFNDNLTATVTYNNGSTKVVNPTNIDGYNMSISGEQIITVEYTEKDVSVSDTYTIQIDKIKPVSLDISGEFQIDFFVGDTFNHNGLVATATYNNDSVLDVSEDVQFTSPDMNTAGTKNVVVSYSLNGVTVSDNYDIEVTAIVPNKIELSGNPKDSFFVGDTFTSSGLVVTATFNNGNISDATSLSTVTGPDMSTAGIKPVNVSFTYGGKTVYASYNITIANIVPVSITVSGYKSSFYVGDTFSLGNISLDVTYNNGEHGSAVPTSYDAPNLNSEGTKQVKVYYTENGTTVSTTYNVSVTKVVPVTLEISGSYQTEFNVGDTFTYSGLKANVSFNNGSSREVTPLVSTPDMSSKGEKPVTVSYTENGTTVLKTYSITVNAIVHSLSLDNSNLKTDIHDSIHKILTAEVNADIGAVYNLEWSVDDGTVISLVESGNSVSITPLKVGTTTIRAVAGGKSASCVVEVTSLVSSISISGNQTIEVNGTCNLSATVLPNDAIDQSLDWTSSNPSILKVTGNGKQATVEALGFTGSSATITASAKDGSGKSGSITISIISIQSIRIEFNGINNDNKIPFAKYKANEDVNAKVLAVWSNGSTTDVTESATKNFKVNCLVLGEQEIDANYQGFSTSLKVKVTNEGSSSYVGWNVARITRSDELYNATPLQQAEAWADYFIKQTGGGDYDGPCKLPASERENALKEVWNDLNAEYGYMAADSKDEFCDESTSSVKISSAMVHYRHICKTYSVDQFVEDSHYVKPNINNSPSFLLSSAGLSIIGVGAFFVVGAVFIIIFVSCKKHKHRGA